MATYLELRGLFNDGDLQNKVDVAVVKSAQTLIDGTPTADQQKWASHALSRPRVESKKALIYVLAARSDQTVDAIKTATDGTIQSNVDAAVPTLVAAYAAANP